MPVSPEEFDAALRELEALSASYSYTSEPERDYQHFDALGDYDSIREVFDAYIDHEFSRDELYDWLDANDYDVGDFWDDFRDYYGSD